jgi:nitroreductase
MSSPFLIPPATAAQVDALLRGRCTRKVLDGARLPGMVAGPAARAAFDRELREAIAAAGWAPFHYASSEQVPEPWRFTVLDRDALDLLSAQFPELQVGKLPQIFAGAGALVQVTYLEEPEGQHPERNSEHHSAAAAAAMALLLACEARGLGSYWCTARVLDEPALRNWAGLEARERWLGGVFIGLPLDPERERTEGFAGKQRARRTAPEAGWMRWPRLKLGSSPG